MPKLAPPSFNGVNLPPDLRRVLEAAMRPAAAALNKALVVGDSLQVWGPVLVTGTGAGTVGVAGSGTTGSIPKWSGSTSLADSGASMDGNNRLAVPVGIAFPGGSTLDAAPAAGVTGSGAAGLLAFWLSASVLSSDSALFWDNTNKRLGIGIATPATYFHAKSAGQTAVIESTDTTGNVLPLIIKNVAGVAGLPGVGFQDALAYCGDVLGRDTAGFGLVAGMNLSASAGLGIGFRIGSNNVAAFDNNFNFAIGTSPGSAARATILGGAQHALDLTAAPADCLSFYRNTNTAGWSGILFQDSAGTYKVAFFYGNSAVANVNQRGVAGINTNGAVDFVFTNNDTSEHFRIKSTGAFVYPSTDSSASPGAATINKPTGRSAIAAGASSVIITNSLVTAASQVRITKRQFDTTLTDYYATCAAGTFTVTGNAAATAAWAFDWEVLN